MSVKYSIVVPVFNEEESIPLFIKRMVPVMDQTMEPYEIIFVNDGSRDRTPEILKEEASKNPNIKVINFSRNFGQQAALLCGFKASSGEAVVDIDVDLQDKPETILLMIEKWKEGYDVVHGRRTVRKGETFFKKWTSSVYTKFLAKITGMNIPRNTGDFKLFDRKVIDTLTSLPEHNRFLRGLTTFVGYKQTFVDFDRDERVAGKTKYNLKKLLKLAENGIVANSDFPLRLPLFCGVILNVLSMITFITFIVLECLSIHLGAVGWMFPTIAILFSYQFIFNGLSNIYEARIYDEVKGRPIYIVRDKINF
jgi:polyisoprenyl-phosphate glycosyltransferase